VAQARRAAGRTAQPTAGAIDSQSVKTSEKASLSGFDAGKRIKRRKRRVIADTCGNLLACTVRSAGIRDRDGAPEVFARLRREAPTLRHIFANGGHTGPKLRDAPGYSCQPRALEAADRAARRHRQGPCGAAPQVCRRAHRRRARPLPTSGAGSGKNRQERQGMPRVAHIPRPTRRIARA
jgi:hypothetical protein